MKTAPNKISFEEDILKKSILYVIAFMIISLIGDFFVLGFGLLQQIYSLNLIFLGILYLLTKRVSCFKLLIPYTLLVLSTITAIWLLNGGLEGVAPYLFLAFSVILMFISPSNSRILYFVLIIILFFSLTITDLYFPEFITNLTPPEQRILELAVSIFILLNALFLIVNKFLLILDESKQNELDYSNKLVNKNLELNKLNEELQENNLTLRNLNKVQRQLQTIIVHDIKSPIRSVINGLDLMSINIEKNLDVDDLRFFRSIKDSTNQVSLVIENILMMTKFEGKSLQFKNEKFKLREQIDSQIILNTTAAKLKNIDIFNKVGEGLEVNFDKNIFSIIFRNILTNSIKYSYPNSKIDVYYQEGDNNYEIIVKDYGMGMDKNLIDNLYKGIEIQSILNTNTENSTGFGLKIIKALLKAANQDLLIESKPELGTTVIFTVPK
jgi:signal transduction histidine kinase